MAAARKSISIADAVSYVLADHDSDLSDSDFEHSESESSSDEDQQHVVNEIAAPNFRRRIRTRGGINARNATPQGRGRRVNQVTRHKREMQLEDTWSRNDRDPVIHEFSANAGLQANFDKENATVLDYLKLFITEDFYELISVQTNLYADQYIEANPDSATSRQWRATTAKEIRHFLALYLLTGFIKKPQVRQCWSTDPLCKLPSSTRSCHGIDFKRYLSFYTLQTTLIMMQMSQTRINCTK